MEPIYAINLVVLILVGTRLIMNRDNSLLKIEQKRLKLKKLICLLMSKNKLLNLEFHSDYILTLLIQDII
jgi:hypothetical protein